MSTGQASSRRRARSASPATPSSTSMPMKVASVLTPPLRRPVSPTRATRRSSRRGSGSQPRTDQIGYLGDLLGDGDAGRLEAGDLLRRRVLPALDDRAGVA